MNVPRLPPLAGWIAVACVLVQFPAVVYLLAATALSINHNPPVTIFEAELHSVEGRTVYIDFRGIRHRNCELLAIQEWRQKGRATESKENPNKVVFDVGEPGWGRLKIDLPKRLKPGRYQVRSKGEYKCPDGGFHIVPLPWLDVTLR